ncbi:hypothetical protein [Oceanospirillum sediminis]|uniref:Uncharacterized protein n=1 Tax=Oceanospirillum sediminis TaxID=2760088 RepID=A0A839IY73_9GAMM|nr:hypothetical protein [Oceanospirillum sediminis]MBB1489389.1 hypothetical protein [Oceanospirillum sediminis]
MEPLTKAEFEALPEDKQLEKLQELVDLTGAEIDTGGDKSLVDIYLAHLPDPKDKKRMAVRALQSVRFLDDDKKRRTLLKDSVALVGVNVAEQLKAEGLVTGAKV